MIGIYFFLGAVIAGIAIEQGNRERKKSKKSEYMGGELLFGMIFFTLIWPVIAGGLLLNPEDLTPPQAQEE